jgi:nucleoside-diphosphate-sugar epimerase
MTSPAPLSVAVTGPTGTFGYGLLPLLQEDDRIGTVVGIARRPFDPSANGWTKMTYRQGDVQDEAALRDAFTGMDVVVHLAFLIVGGDRETTQAINVDGTLNAFRAAAAAGVKRFVYASSVAAYGFHRDNPVGMTEEWPTRPAERLFYAQEKAELDQRLHALAAEHPDVELYLLRPSIVVGPHTVGGKDILPGPLAPLGRRLRPRRLPFPLPGLVPDIELQLVHEDDVGQALQLCIVGAGSPGSYNIAGDGALSMVAMARELRVLPIALPARPVRAAARMASHLPLPSVAGWVEVLTHPAIMDTTKAKTVLGWTPRYTGLEALRDTLDR